jgi:signal transduction histidine kinase
MTLDQQVGEMGPGDHICLIYETFEEQVRALVPFVRDGLERGERCVYIVDENTAEDVSAAMASGGLDVDRELSRDALRFNTKRDSYLATGEFVPAAMIDFLREAEAEALKDGFTGLRITGEMTWALGPETGCDRLIEYEAMLNRYFPDSNALAICQYNRERFDPEVIEGVLLTHPIAVLGEAVLDNLYYEPPEGILNGWTAGDRVAWKLKRLRRAHEVSQELREAKSAAEAASLARSQFVAVISHELRTPLNALVGYTHLLETGIAGPLNEQQSRYVARMKASATVLADLVEEILLLSRIETNRAGLAISPVDIVALIRKVTGHWQEAAEEKGLVLTVDLPAAPIRIETDPVKVEQVMESLIENAVKFTNEGEVAVSARNQGSEVTVAIRDTGAGVDLQHVETIFEPFWQADQSHTRVAGGTGLGLAISRRLARLLGGEIELASEVGKGSTFTLRLPVTLSRDEREQPAA